MIKSYILFNCLSATLRQHQRRVLSASSCSKSLCSSFNNRFMLPGSFSSSESSSEEPVRSKDDTDVNIGSTTDDNIGSTKYTGVRKTKSMHAGYCKLIQVNQCKETRFSTLPRKIQKVNSMNNKEAPDTVHKRLPVFDLEELDVSLGPVSPGLPGMCEITPRPLSKNPNNCTCCSICEMMSPRSVDFNNRNGHSNCSCEHCIYSSKDKPGLVQYKHGNVIKTFDWLKQYAKETALWIAMLLAVKLKEKLVIFIVSWQINVRKYRNGNQKGIIQRNWQHRVHRTKTNKSKTRHNIGWSTLYGDKHK